MSTRWAHWQKVSDEAMPILDMLLPSKSKIQQDLLRKGKRALNITVRIGRTGNDFVRDTHTVVMEYNVYKINRLIKHYVLKNIPLHNRNHRRLFRR